MIWTGCTFRACSLCSCIQRNFNSNQVVLKIHGGSRAVNKFLLIPVSQSVFKHRLFNSPVCHLWLAAAAQCIHLPLLRRSHWMNVLCQLVYSLRVNFSSSLTRTDLANAANEDHDSTFTFDSGHWTDPFHCRGVCVGRSKSQSKSFTIQTVKWIGFNQRVRFQTLRFCLETRSQAHEEGCWFDFRRGGLQCLSSQSVSFCLSHCHVMSVSQSVSLFDRNLRFSMQWAQRRFNLWKVTLLLGLEGFVDTVFHAVFTEGAFVFWKSYGDARRNRSWRPEESFVNVVNWAWHDWS